MGLSYHPTGGGGGGRGGGAVEDASEAHRLRTGSREAACRGGAEVEAGRGSGGSHRRLYRFCVGRWRQFLRRGKLERMETHPAVWVSTVGDSLMLLNVQCLAVEHYRNSPCILI
jgi:hypothetical protein